MLLAIVARRRSSTNVALAAAAPWGVDARILAPEQAGALVRFDSVALGRLDVSEALDGVEDGLWALGSLAARRVRVLNRAGALLAATRVAMEPPPDALQPAVRPAAAAGTELVGVDLLPDGAGGYTVLELNGAVDFTREYRIDRDPFVAAMAELARLAQAAEAASVDPDPFAATEGAR